MTCIVAIRKGEKAYLGADAAAVNSMQITPRKDPKVFMNGQFGIAYTSSFRMGDILQYSWKAPTWRPSEISLEAFMRTVFIDSIIQIFRDKGYGKSSADSDKTGGSFLVGVQGRIFTIQDDFQVGEELLDYLADGSGFAYAYGSLHSTGGVKDPKERLTMALEAAAFFAPGVQGPFTIIEC